MMVTGQVDQERTQQESEGEDGVDAGAAPAAVAAAPPAGGRVFDRLGGVQVSAAVELGSTELLLRDVAALGAGSVVQLDRLVGEPADLTLNGCLFARGDVVVVDDHLGLRITELVEPAPDVAP